MIFIQSIDQKTKKMHEFPIIICEEHIHIVTTILNSVNCSIILIYLFICRLTF